MIIEEHDFRDGVEYYIIFNDMGWRCAYIALPENDPLNGLPYEKIYDIVDLDEILDNEITFSGKLPFDDSDKYWIGFDYAHLYDTLDYESFRKYFPNENETYERLKRQAIQTEKIFGSKVRTLEYVKNEIYELIDKLTKTNLLQGE